MLVRKMSTSVTKKRHGSKKTKKSWRKTDIHDVEEFLEDKRLEERLGVPFAQRTNEDLFVVDTHPNAGNIEALEYSKKQRCNEILKKPPRCFEALRPDSQVPDPVVKRNRVRTSEERKHPLVRQKEKERRKKGVLKAKELDAQRNRKVDAERRKNKPRRGDFSTDLWDEGKSSVPLEPELKSDWVEPTVRKHILVNMGRQKKSHPDGQRSKPYVLPAVEPPHPGMSYNPTFSEHQELLQTIAAKENKLIKEDEHIKRVTTSLFKKLPRHEAEQQWIKEMSEGVPALDPAAAMKDEKVEDDGEYHAINPPTDREKKKNLKTRRKAREELRKLSERLRAKQEQKKISDLYRVKKLQDELSKAEQRSLLLQKKRELKRAARVAKTKRLGTNKFQERELEFNMASDLKGSLRGLKPEGNILADRFASLQKRNIMEVSARQNLRIAKKKKRFLKASHKMAWEVHPLQKPAHLRKKHHSMAVLGQK